MSLPLVLLGTGLLLGSSAPMAPASGPVPAPRAVRDTSWPFEVGERLQFSAKLGILRLGTAWMSVTGIDTVRGNPSFVFEFGLSASAPFYHSTNVMQSWTGTQDLISRRFHQDLVENGRRHQRYFEIYPDSQVYEQEQRPGSQPSVSDPLDDAAFFYFLRTIPLEVGKTYRYDRYFKKAMNPVVIKVSKTENMELPDGTKVPCLILNPVVGEEGVFAPRAKAELWLTSDARRIPVQIRSRLPFGTVTLRLEKMTEEPPAP